MRRRTSPRRKQRGRYTSYVFGEGDRQVKVMLLAARYHRDHPSRSADMLGAEQWHRLEEELTSSNARIDILVSRIRAIP